MSFCSENKNAPVYAERYILKDAYCLELQRKWKQLK